MAVLQISKIQVRRGQELQTGVPGLSSGEFAWSIDRQKLYIGNGSVSEGAPQIGVTEVLTQYSDIFSLLPSYTYGQSFTTSNISVTSGPDANHPVVRSLQQKLDDVITLNDFIFADTFGNIDYTACIQNAIYQIFLNTDQGQVKQVPKALHIPAGTYQLTATIFIPPNTTILGDGIDKTTLVQNTSTSIFQFAGINPNVVSGSSPAQRLTTLPNIQSSGNQPQNISLQNMTLEMASAGVERGQFGLIEVDCALDSEIKNLKFLGATNDPTNDTVKAVEIRGQGATTTKNLNIKDCIFDTMAYGVYSDYDVNYIKIQNNVFRNMGQGIAFGASLTGPSSQVSTVGPQFVSIKGNRFENTYLQAVYVGIFNTATTVLSHVVSIENEYINCGNHTKPQVGSNDNFPFTEVITFQTQGNASIDDYFARDENNTSGQPTTYLPSVLGYTSVHTRGPKIVNLIQRVAAQTVLVLAKTNTDQAIKISYVATQPFTNTTRRGELKITCNSITPILTDEYTYYGTSDGGLVFNASLTTSTNAITISALNPNAPTTLEYQYQQLY
jgi:hypothetical protein